MSASASVEGTEAFKRAAEALNEAGDQDLRKEVYAGFRRAAKPLGDKVIGEGSAGLPHRGGLAARTASSKMSQSNATTGRNPGVALRFRSLQGYSLKAFDEGTIRHPVFARGQAARVWVKQSIRPQQFTRPFDAGKEAVQKEIVASLESVADRIARNTSKGPL